ncbi:MAG: tetratricopeptide repeat protein [Clostridia bacterium]|nr:tetratricopeptide repeat protein [Clostridia bacterium]
MSFQNYESCFIHCKTLIKEHRYEEAMTCSHELLKLYEETRPDTPLVNVFDEVEAFFLNVPNGILHFTYLNKLAKLYEEQGLYNQQLEVMYNIAQDYIDATEYTLAKALLHRGILQSKSMNFCHRECDFLNGLGRISNEHNEYEKGLQYYKSAYQKALDCNYEKGRRFAHNIGYTLGRLKRYDEAVGYFNETIKYMCSHSNPSYCANTYNEFGYVLIQLKRFDEAEEILEKAYKLCIESGSYFFLAENYLFQSKLYEIKGNTKKAFEFYKVYHEQHEKISKANNKQQLKNYAYEQVLEKKTLETEVIRLKNIELDHYAKELDLLNKSLEASLSEIDALENEASINKIHLSDQELKWDKVLALKELLLNCYDHFIQLKANFHNKNEAHFINAYNTANENFKTILAEIKKIEGL